MFFDLKSTISRAIGQNGPNLPFHIGQRVLEQDSNSLWVLHDGTKKDDQQPISVFIFDIKSNSKFLELARNAFKRAKTLRYPDCLKYIDGVEVSLID
jgi:SCY1-like protein 1